MEKGKKTIGDHSGSMQKVVRTPPKTAQAREDQLIAMAYDRVEDRIRNNQATGPELVHFLKLGSSKGKLEKDILEQEKELVSAKTQSLRSQQSTEELYNKVLEAMKSYSGSDLNE